MADGEYSHVSSSLIKQVGRFGGAEALEPFVPAELIEPIIAKLGRQTSSDRSVDDDERSPRSSSPSETEPPAHFQFSGMIQVARPLADAQPWRSSASCRLLRAFQERSKLE